MSTLVAGATVCGGRYRLDEVIGRGGMAIVWRATDLQLERPVAIKIISDVLASDPSYVARFEREARLAAALNHPNLVKVFDYSSSEDGRPLLVMEYIPGGTLVERGDTADALELARALLDALSHIHRAGILHRDIKPANVLLDAEGSPRLTDFGIARSEDQTALTLTGQVMGTLRYIAPEVAEGRPATRQSDLYSLGVLLNQVVGERGPKQLQELLRRMTAADPSQRPPSAEAALAELEPTRALEQNRPDLYRHTRQNPGQPGETEPTRRIRVRIRARRRLWAAVAATALLAALVAVVIVISSGGSSGKTAQTPQPAPAGAPLTQQLDRLEQLVNAAPARKAGGAAVK